MMDGAEVSTIRNKVAGAGWRTWLDTTSATVALPAGEHELTIRFDCDGPTSTG